MTDGVVGHRPAHPPPQRQLAPLSCSSGFQWQLEYHAECRERAQWNLLGVEGGQVGKSMSLMVTPESETLPKENTRCPRKEAAGTRAAHLGNLFCAHACKDSAKKTRREASPG